jgi:hypothetical protein
MRRRERGFAVVLPLFRLFVVCAVAERERETVLAAVVRLRVAPFALVAASDVFFVLRVARFGLSPFAAAPTARWPVTTGVPSATPSTTAPQPWQTASFAPLACVSSP